MRRSSRQEVFCKKDVLRNFARFTGKHLFKKRPWHRCFPVNLAKFLRTPPVAASGCSRNLEFEKRTDQNFITQNLCHRKEYCISKKKRLLKQC